MGYKADSYVLSALSKQGFERFAADTPLWIELEWFYSKSYPRERLSSDIQRRDVAAAAAMSTLILHRMELLSYFYLNCDFAGSSVLTKK